jgi:predicted ATPase
LWDDCLQRIVISGCSGGGKSTLIDALARLGEHIVLEPGRRIVQAELQGNGQALPWNNLGAFARKALDLAREDLEQLDPRLERVFFDRGLIDAAVAVHRAEGIPLKTVLGSPPTFCPLMFFAPPWEEHFQQDLERQSGWTDALSEATELRKTYTSLGFTIVELPKCPVPQRVSFVLNQLPDS